MGDRLVEQETVIRWDMEDEVVTIWTAHPNTAKKLRRLGFDPQVFGYYRPSKKSKSGVKKPRSWECRVPLSRFRWGKTAAPRKYSEAQHTAMQERGRKLQQQRQSNPENTATSPDKLSELSRQTP
jgi:hypothetical protein